MYSKYGVIGGVTVVVVVVVIVTTTVVVRNDKSPSNSPAVPVPTIPNTPTPTDPTPTNPSPTRSTEEQIQVACDFLTFTSLSVCQSSTNVSTSLSGTIPTELGLLTQFTLMSLFGNQLTGNIPSTLGDLVQLQYLSLSGNRLSGTVPSTFGNLIQLTYLGVYNNRLNGTIPSTLCSNSGIKIYMDCGEISTCTCCQGLNRTTMVSCTCPSP